MKKNLICSHVFQNGSHVSIFAVCQYGNNLLAKSSSSIVNPDIPVPADKINKWLKDVKSALLDQGQTDFKTSSPETMDVWISSKKSGIEIS